MEDLRLVGVSDDGSRLVLESGGGDRYGVPLDERLHAALRGDRARLGQLQIAIEGQLRPREIQTRIRSGETAEEIAAQAGLPVDKVRRYEGPILLERTVIAQNAQTVGVRRVTDTVTTPLGVLVRSRLEGHQVDEDSLDWDSWLHADGRWLVRLVYRANGQERAATWLYDAGRRTVEPADDEARWLTDEERATAHPPQRSRGPRLAAVPAEQPDAEVGRHDTVPLAKPQRPRAVPDALPDVEDDAPDVATDETEQLASADDSATSRPATADTANRDDTADTADTADTEDVGDVPEPAPPVRPAARANPRGRGGGKRAAVPSWDEILFGSPKRDSD